ncbi:MAG: hypothetical protein PUJ09_05450 [Eubacteriales bacterium]|nr:hypothetical protein [Eubacteriales bacterium]
MKKYIVKGTALVAALIILACCLTSCNRISGTYTSEDSSIYTSYKFSLFSDKVVISIIDVPFTATYEIDGDKIYITIADDRQEHSFSKEGNTIYIDGKAFVKQ